MGEEGEFNTEELKTKMVKVGSAIDEKVPLEQVAGKIMAQLARKKISVVEVKIFEYTRKELTFKEEDDGIKIGRRKFSFEDGALVGASKDDELTEEEKLLALLKNNPQLVSQLTGQQQQPKMFVSTPETNILQPQQLQPQQTQAVKTPTNIAAPQRYEVFDPVAAPDYPGCVEEMKRRNWKFTTGKRYPVFQEKMGKDPMDGMFYSTIDDAGIRRDIKSFYFIPPNQGLTGNFMEDGGSYVGAVVAEPKLMFQTTSQYDMPTLRRGAN